MSEDDEIWTTLHRHIQSIFDGDVEAYCATTAEDLSLFEWWVTPHRQDGLEFHRFMIAHRWAGADWRYDLLEPRLQRYGDCAIVSYTFMFSTVGEGAIAHRTHNESRVLVRQGGAWRVVHVHKSPATPQQHP